MKNIIFGITLVCLVALSPGCEQIDELCNGLDCFSFDEFSENLQNKFSGNCVGCGFIVKHETSTNNFWFEGDAVLNTTSFFSNTDMHIASISKTISAMALVRAIDNNNTVTLDSPMAPFLPNTWSIGTNVSGITFRELLTHTSGFRASAYFEDCSASNLKSLVAAGINLSDKTMSYQNVNFGLMRYLIPALDGFTPLSSLTADAEFAWEYENYVRQHILQPVGVDGYCDPADSPDPDALSYNGNNPGSGGFDNEGDLTYHAGAFGWQLSVGDVATIFSNFFTNNTILSVSQRNAIMNGQLGIFTWAGSEGTYYAHNGGWGDNGGRGLNTVYMYFPKNKVTAVVFMNSTPRPEGNKDMRQLVQEAYDASWGF